ncbi:mucin-17-like [Haliotis asinina]|uniref:mucin-17-like n=1 Tax=Haliotis asinina TaxID=109174 RepID=UPI003531FCE6
MKTILFCLCFGALLDISSTRYIAVSLNRNRRAASGYPWQRETPVSGHTTSDHGHIHGQTAHVIHSSEPFHTGGMSSGSGYNQPITITHGQPSSGTYQGSGRSGQHLASSHISGPPQTTHVIHTSEPLHTGGLTSSRSRYNQPTTGTYRGGVRSGQHLPSSHLLGQPQPTHVIHTSEPLHTGVMTSSGVLGQPIHSPQLPSRPFLNHKTSDTAFRSQPVGTRAPSSGQLSSFSSIQDLYRTSLSGGQDKPLNSPVQVSSAKSKTFDGGIAAPPTGDLTSFSSLQKLYRSSSGGDAGAPVIPQKTSSLFKGKDIYQHGLAAGQELYRNRNTGPSNQAGYPGQPSSVPKETQVIADSVFPNGKPPGDPVLPTGGMGPNPSYPDGKPMVVPNSHHGTPLVDPKHSHGVPFPDPSHTQGAPVVDTTIPHGTSFVDPSISHGTPFVDPSISHGTPFVDPAVSHGTPLVDTTISHGSPFPDPSHTHGTPVVDTTISHGTPFVDPTMNDGTSILDPTISHGTPFVDPAINEGTSILDPTISHGTPFVDPTMNDGTSILDPTISHGTPFVDPTMNDGTPVLDPTISHGTPFVDPTISDGNPFVDPTISHENSFVDPSNGLGEPTINLANGPGFSDPLGDPRLDLPGPRQPGPVFERPGPSFSRSDPQPGESPSSQGQPWPGRAPTRRNLPRPSPQAFVETGGPTIENSVGRDLLASTPLDPAAGGPVGSQLPGESGGPNSGTAPLINPVMPSSSKDLLVFTNQPDRWVWSGGDVTGQLRNFRPHRTPQ